MTVKAIETVYKGYRFRSRLEARWAVFFDTLGVEYRYEPEGYRIGPTSGPWPLPQETWYLPDFWLPKQQYWIEIKGQEPTKEEQAVLYWLARETGYSGYLFFGDCRHPEDDRGYDGESAYGFRESWDYVWDSFQYWCECSTCGLLEITYSGRTERLSCDCKHEGRYGSNSPRIFAAYTAARQARFERGAA